MTILLHLREICNKTKNDLQKSFETEALLLISFRLFLFLFTFDDCFGNTKTIDHQLSGNALGNVYCHDEGTIKKGKVHISNFGVKFFVSI